MALIEVELPPEAFDEDWQPTPDSCLGTTASSSVSYFHLTFNLVQLI
jgi:hypothetical protein